MRFATRFFYIKLKNAQMVQRKPAQFVIRPIFCNEQSYIVRSISSKKQSRLLPHQPSNFISFMFVSLNISLTSWNYAVLLRTDQDVHSIVYQIVNNMV